MTRLCSILVACVAVGVLATSASAGMPIHVRVGPLPAVNKAAFFKVTVSGTYAGSAVPGASYLMASNPSVLKGNMVVAAAELPAVVKGGKASVVFVVAAMNPKKLSRRLAAEDALDMIVTGASLQWGGPQGVTSSTTCYWVAQALHKAHVSWTGFWAGESHVKKTAEEFIQEAERLGKC